MDKFKGQASRLYQVERGYEVGKEAETVNVDYCFEKFCHGREENKVKISCGCEKRILGF